MSVECHSQQEELMNRQCPIWDLALSGSQLNEASLEDERVNPGVEEGE